MRTWLIAFSVAACGGGNDGTGSVLGTIRGQNFAVADAVSARTLESNATDHASIALSWMPDACSDLTANIERKNDKLIVITLADVSGMSMATPTAPGTYTISATTGPKNATLSLSATDMSCAGVTASSATAASGTVTLTSITGEAFGGSFSVVLDSGDQITGTFDPVACPELGNALTGNWAPTCM